MKGIIIVGICMLILLVGCTNVEILSVKQIGENECISKENTTIRCVDCDENEYNYCEVGKNLYFELTCWC